MLLPAVYFNCGDVIRIKYPYQEKDGDKLRPVVITAKDSKQLKLVVLKGTSKENRKNWRKKYDYKVKYPKHAGFTKETIIRCDHYFVIPNNLLCQKIGTLEAKDMHDVEELFFDAQNNKHLVFC